MSAAGPAAGDGRQRPDLPAGAFLVVGLARSGQAAARVLAGLGRNVTGVDAGRPEGAAELAGAGLKVVLETDGLDALAELAAGAEPVTVIKSPGVPRESAVIEAALRGETEVIGELELGWRLLPNRFIAVTGTNGKTTTVEMLGAIYRAAGLPVAVAGNVGTPLCSLVGALPEDATVVCEASSFQLEDTAAFAPDCAVLINVTPDHVDRHGSFEAYRDAKLRIFENQMPWQHAILPAGFDVAIAGGGKRVDFVPLVDGWLCRQDQQIVAAAELAAPGPHNLVNAKAAATAALLEGVNATAISAGLTTFVAPDHRMQVVGEVDGVNYVNDSKATNPDAAAAALSSYRCGVHVILGGSLKGGSFAVLREPLQAVAVKGYLIGEAAAALEQDLAGTVPLERFESLSDAVQSAAATAGPGDTVLLSPACASFDQFSDFAERGNRFAALVAGLRT